MAQAAKTQQPSKTEAVQKASRAVRTCVLHLCPDLEAGDPARETLDLAVLTQRSGWRALIASNGGALVNDGERAAVRHTRMPLHRHGMITRWRNRVHLEALIKKERPSLIHAHGVDVLALASGLSRSHHLPLVVDLTQPLQQTSHVKRKLAQLATLSASIRVPSEYMGQHLLDDFHVAPEQIYLVPPGVDLQWYNAGAISPERLQKLSSLWRLPDQASVILVPMPFVAGSGHNAFLNALRQLKSENIFAVMVGSDRHAPGLRAETEHVINNYKLQGKVIMPDVCQDWPAAFWLSSVIVAPNIMAQGQNLEVLAAQAIGRPAVVTDVGANREMIVRGETAWVVKPNDPKLLAEALREAIHMDTNQRLNLADRTRQFIVESYPQVAWTSGMMELYENLLRPTARVAKTKTKAAA